MVSLLVRDVRRHVTALPAIARWMSTISHTVKDIEVPVPFVQGHIAAKLWESRGGPSSPAGKVPPIICVQGWGDTVTAFEPLVPLLLANRPGQRVLAFDFPGHGLSYHTPGAYSDLHMEGLMTILRIIRHFSWDKVTILGHSLGGLIGLSFTSTFPDLVQNLIGIEIFHPLHIHYEGYRNYLSLASHCIEGLLDMETKMLNPDKRPLPSYTRDEMIKRMVKGRAGQGGLSPAGCDMLIDRGSKKLPDGKLQFTHDPRNTQFFFLARLSLGNLSHLAKGVTCPTALITCHVGMDGDVLQLPGAKELVDSLTANAKSFRHDRVAGPHHINMLHPESVAPIINEFLHKSY